MSAFYFSWWLNGITYYHPWRMLLAAIGLIVWSLKYFYIFKSPELYFPIKAESNISNCLKIYKIIKGFLYFLGVLCWSIFAIYLGDPYQLQERPPTYEIQNNMIDSFVKELESYESIVLIDVSKSMLEKFSFQNTRIDKVKEILSAVFQKLVTTPNIRATRVGVVVFADSAYTLSPLTRDYKYIFEQIKEIKIGPLGDGTDISNAILFAINKLSSSKNYPQKIILWSDGADQSGAISPVQVASKAYAERIKIDCVGVSGNRFDDKVNFLVLEQIAKAAGGEFKYINYKNTFQRSINPESEKDFKIWVTKSYLYWAVMLFLLVEILRKILFKEVL